MNTKHQGIALWTGASLVVGALVYGGFIYPRSVRADAGTLLSMCELHLGLAQQLPLTDGVAKQQRKDNIDKALAILDDVEAESPGLSITSEFRGFAEWMRSDFEAAKRAYGEALSRAGDDAALRLRLENNLAAIDLESGKPERAIARLEGMENGRRDASTFIVEAQAWQAKGDAKKRSQALADGLRRAAKNQDANGIYSIAEAAASLGDAIATSAFEELGAEHARARYRLAQLKINEGATDTATSMLEAIAKTAPEALKRWVSEDRGFWIGDRKALADRVLSVTAGPTR